MKFANDPLWQKIDTFSLHDPAFTQKLAKENNWTPGFTERAISEYKRFIYLCCIMPNGASPPPVVDEVWHLHILYTVNYWEEFCDRTLGRKLHHHPSGGGLGEKERHVNWLEDTIKNYRFIFEEEPPPDIWGTASPPNLNINPPSGNKRPVFPRSILVLLLIILIAVFNNMNYAFLPWITFGAIIIIVLSASSNKKGNGSGGCSGSSCSSSCSSSCGSSCGGGCGGCGGD
ncbi:hypothetical protein SAMN04488055_0306 [Chitinophaga niabensis]|uniref:TIGR04222 domain-containing protein n=2 Tax=Chitinophaga niabensis TaxID=536979 RepID=A0A1N6D5S0_9BACT|nr:hypothetical protein SAMN04488055_0306 [Chitinophaga niabensis]